MTMTAAVPKAVCASTKASKSIKTSSQTLQIYIQVLILHPQAKTALLQRTTMKGLHTVLGSTVLNFHQE
jgi:hypothetical protein